MKNRFLSLLLVTLLLMGAAGVFAEEGRAFDSRTDKFDTIIEINSLKYEWLTDLDALDVEKHDPALAIALAWYNLLAHELQQGTPINETMAADIYRGIKKGPGVAVLTAEDDQNTYFNVLFAVQVPFVDGGKTYTSNYAYWIEWDMEQQSMRAVKNVGLEKYRTDEEYLRDYVFNSLIAASSGGNALFGSSTAANSLQFAYGAKQDLYKMLDGAYREVNDNKPVPIK